MRARTATAARANPKKPRKPGRPRDERATQAILDVTLEHLGKHGYAGLSVEAIAADAGVTKPALYRRWGSKEDLVTAAISEWRNRSMPEITGDFEVDLEANLRQLGRRLNEPLGVAMIAALLLEERKNPTLIELYRERSFTPRFDALRRILLHARREGALDAGFDLETVMAMIQGAYYVQLIRGEPIPAKWPREIMKIIFPLQKRAAVRA